MEKRWAVGVRVIGWFDLVLGILGVLTFLLRGPIIIVTSPLLIVLGIGLLKFKEWARKFTILLYILGYLFRMVMNFISSKDFFLTIKYFSQLKQLLGLLVTVVVIYFLTRPKVKEQFK